MSFLAKFSPLLLSVLRIVTGLILLQHGTSKFLGIPESQMTGVDVKSMFGIAGIFELVGGALLVIGLVSACGGGGGGGGGVAEIRRPREGRGDGQQRTLGAVGALERSMTYGNRYNR